MWVCQPRAGLLLQCMEALTGPACFCNAAEPTAVHKTFGCEAAARGLDDHCSRDTGQAESDCMLLILVS